ncbi:MAG: hypothetical protein MZV64_42935 [Ignavibacteriales bacterium]|nr:hypothetical protein [Ignavibacteriales bacterium]
MPRLPRPPSPLEPSNKSTDVGGTASFAAEVVGFPPPALSGRARATARPGPTSRIRRRTAALRHRR